MNARAAATWPQQFISLHSTGVVETAKDWEKIKGNVTSQRLVLWYGKRRTELRVLLPHCRQQGGKRPRSPRVSPGSLDVRDGAGSAVAPTASGSGSALRRLISVRYPTEFILVFSGWRPEAGRGAHAPSSRRPRNIAARTRLSGGPTHRDRPS